MKQICDLANCCSESVLGIILPRVQQHPMVSNVVYLQYPLLLTF